jgi:hypothetical protein
VYARQKSVRERVRETGRGRERRQRRRRRRRRGGGGGEEEPIRQDTVTGHLHTLETRSFSGASLASATKLTTWQLPPASAIATRVCFVLKDTPVIGAAACPRRQHQRVYTRLQMSVNDVAVGSREQVAQTSMRRSSTPPFIFRSHTCTTKRGSHNQTTRRHGAACTCTRPRADLGEVLRCRAQVARRTAEGNVSHRLHAYDAGIHSPTPPLTLPTHAHAS